MYIKKSKNGRKLKEKWKIWVILYLYLLRDISEHNEFPKNKNLKGSIAICKEFDCIWDIWEHNESATDSPLWRRIADRYPRVLSLTRWLNIGKGNIGFWTDNWAGEILGGPLPCDARLTVAQGLLWYYN